MYKKNKGNILNYGEIFRHVVLLIFLLCALFFLRWAIVDVYKPQEKNYILKSTQAYAILSDELSDFYKKHGYIWASADGKEDKFCEALRKKYSPQAGSCTIEKNATDKENLKFKKITLHGFSNPPFYQNKVLIKDIYIDINGPKGKNKFGIDRVPLRIYSSGRLGGTLSPVSCNKEDFERFSVPYSQICPEDVSINFLDSEIPFAYSVRQIGGKSGKSKYLNKKVSLLRADCVAFGGDLTGAVDYCDYRKYQWLTACYHEYPCTIELNNQYN